MKIGNRAMLSRFIKELDIIKEKVEVIEQQTHEGLLEELTDIKKSINILEEEFLLMNMDVNKKLTINDFGDEVRTFLRG
jgi:hypothetical protein